MNPTALPIHYPAPVEKIGAPDPTAPGYLGTYSPPPVYLSQLLKSTEVLS